MNRLADAPVSPVADPDVRASRLAVEHAPADSTMRFRTLVSAAAAAVLLLLPAALAGQTQARSPVAAGTPPVCPGVADGLVVVDGCRLPALMRLPVTWAVPR